MSKRISDRGFQINALAILTFWSVLSGCGSIAAGNISEIRLEHSINNINDNLDGISMIERVIDRKFYNIKNEDVVLFTNIISSTRSSDLYEKVYAFDKNTEVEFSETESPDCSVSRTLVFRVKTNGEDRLVVVTADRIESNSGKIPVQSDSRPQKLRRYSVRRNDLELPNRSFIWLDKVDEMITKNNYCDAKDIEEEMRKFAG